jgi:hypothetical protein
MWHRMFTKAIHIKMLKCLKTYNYIDIVTLFEGQIEDQNINKSDFTVILCIYLYPSQNLKKSLK